MTEATMTTKTNQLANSEKIIQLQRALSILWSSKYPDNFHASGLGYKTIIRSVKIGQSSVTNSSLLFAIVLLLVLILDLVLDLLPVSRPTSAPWGTSQLQRFLGKYIIIMAVLVHCYLTKTLPNLNLPN